MPNITPGQTEFSADEERAMRASARANSAAERYDLNDEAQRNAAQQRINGLGLNVVISGSKR